jgi:hypothetical protein
MEVMDAIPMSEIEMVMCMQDTRAIKKIQSDMSEYSKTESVSRSKNDEHPQNNVLQIKTLADGYNSGRIYYLRVTSDDEKICSEIVAKLRDSSQAARKRQVVLSRFKRIQRRARAIHDSASFQSCVAILICVVSHPPTHKVPINS